MISLFIDTSYKSLFIGIVNDNILIDKVNIFAEATFAEKLVPEIDSIFRKNNLELKDINKLFVTVGPGSFTGIRIGLAVCKTLAFALNKRIIPISSLEFMATTTTDTKFKIPFIDARHGKVFAGVYDSVGNTVIPDSYCSLSELQEKIEDSYTFISYDNLDGINSIVPDYDVVKIVKKYLEKEN